VGLIPVLGTIFKRSARAVRAADDLADAASQLARHADDAAEAVADTTKRGAFVAPRSIAATSVNTTRLDIPRTNPSDWHKLRDLWDDIGYEDILSKANRDRIAKGRTLVVDDDWITHFPGDQALRGEKIPMHHVQGSPLPASRHLDAHMPGGFRYNPEGPGTSG
jgi:filamentous hemagglutinin